jgi:hypothetical protein
VVVAVPRTAADQAAAAAAAAGAGLLLAAGLHRQDTAQCKQHSTAAGVRGWCSSSWQTGDAQQTVHATPASSCINPGWPHLVAVAAVAAALALLPLAADLQAAQTHESRCC